MRHLLPSARQLRVAANAALLVVLALAVPAEVDGVGVHVDVHEVVDDFTLDVILHPVDEETAADVDDLDEGQAPAGRRIKRSASLRLDGTSCACGAICMSCRSKQNMPSGQ